MKQKNYYFYDLYHTCQRCNGSGFLIIDILYSTIGHSDTDFYIYKVCDRCAGNKKLTWIEEVFGPVKPLYNKDEINQEIRKFKYMIGCYDVPTKYVEEKNEMLNM